MLIVPPYCTASKDGIGIRPYHHEDGVPMYEAVAESLDYLNTYLSCFRNTNQQEIQGLVDACINVWTRGDQFFFVIFDTNTNQILGSTSVDRIDPFHYFANLGYWVRKSALRRGVATTASLLAAKFAFEQLQLLRLEIVTDLTNIPSQRVAERMGAIKEGVLRKRLVHNNTSHSAFMYSLIPEDLGLPQLRIL